MMSNEQSNGEKRRLLAWGRMTWNDDQKKKRARGNALTVGTSAGNSVRLVPGVKYIDAGPVPDSSSTKRKVDLEWEAVGPDEGVDIGVSTIEQPRQ